MAENGNGKTKEQLLEMMKKVLLLSEDSAAPEGEKAAAKEKLALLMKKYSLTMADISTVEGKKKYTEEFTHIMVPTFHGLKAHRWETALAHNIALAFDAETVNTDISDGRIYSICIMGHKNDLSVVEYLFKLTRRIIARKSEVYKGRSYNSFSMGMVAGIKEKLMELKAARDQAAVSCRDLIVIKGDEVIKIKKQMFPNIVQTRSNIHLDGNYLAGVSAGRAVELQKKLR